MRSSFTLTFFVSLCLSIVNGHLRHDGHHHEHHHDHHHHHHHHHHGHRHLNADGGHPDTFDSCMVLCYSDVVYRYGVEFAEKLQSEGFNFEACDEDGNSTERALGATDQEARQWNIPELRGADGKLHIPYIIESHPTFDLHNTYDTIAGAIDHIEKETGVLKFVPRTTETNYIFYGWDTLSDGNSCAAHVGRQITFSKVFIGWCVEPQHKGNIIHETLHSLGFWHEHSRPDRDDYIDYRPENLLSSTYENNFQKSFRINSLGSPYDFNSIMHYGKNAFSKQPQNSAYNTLVPKIDLLPGEVMGQRAGLSEHDVNQLRLLHQCSTGPRSGEIGINELCSPECKCWEFAGECTSDDECMGDLVCADTPDDFSSEQDVIADSLPTADVSWDTVTIECDRFCHQECCQFPNNEAQCLLTCGLQSSSRRLNTAQIPSKMCLSDPDANGSTTTTTTQATTTTTTTTTTQATTTTSNNAKWYIDWGISKCVQSCSGPAPCGGEGKWVQFHNSMQTCCKSHLGWMSSVKSRSYDGCHIIPDGTVPPTNAPTPPPTKAPVTNNPTGSPTHLPTKAPVTKSPTTSPTAPPPTLAPSESPSKTPTGAPTSPPTEAPVTNSPTDSPTHLPTKAPVTKSPTTSPTSPPPTSAPSEGPSKTPTRTPTRNPTSEPTSGAPTQSPTHQPSNSPTKQPDPTKLPTSPPTISPTTGPPSKSPTLHPTQKPTTGVPSKPPTPQPTSTPTEDNIIMYSGQFYVDWAVDGGRCVQDCDGPRPCGGKKDPWEAGFSSESVCCSTMSYRPYSQCTYKVSTPAPITPHTAPAGSPTKQPTNKPTTPVDTRWYPGASKCMNDGQAPSWQHNKYSSQSTCCKSHFNWGYNGCMGIKEVGSGKWYINWGLSKCVKDCEKSQGGSCGGLVPGSWILTHSSASACCTAHMSFASIAECQYNY